MSYAGFICLFTTSCFRQVVVRTAKMIHGFKGPQWRAVVNMRSIPQDYLSHGLHFTVYKMLAIPEPECKSQSSLCLKPYARKIYK